MAKYKLGEICEFYSGTGFPVTYQGKAIGDFPFYKVGDIANNVVAGNVYLSLCNNYISNQDALEIKGTIIPKDTVVFAKIGEALKLNRRALTSCNCLIDNNAMGIAPKRKFLQTGYFFYFMKNLKLQNFAESTTVPSVRKSKLEQIEIETPPLNTQNEVERTLDKISSLITIRQHQLQKLDELIKARFVEMFGELHYNRHGFKIVSVEEVCTMVKDGTHQTPQYTTDDIHGFKFLSSKDVMSQKVDWKNIKYISSELHEKLYSTLKPQRDDILMSKNGVNYGVAAVNDSDEVFDIYVSLALLRPKPIINPIYFRCVLNNPDTKEQFDSSIKGIGVPNLHLGEIKKTKILLPPIKLQNQFAAFVHQVDKSKAAVQKSLDEAQLLFDSLMQQYFG